jgi:hypothetical protein
VDRLRPLASLSVFTMMGKLMGADYLLSIGGKPVRRHPADDAPDRQSELTILLYLFGAGGQYCCA